MNNEQDPQHRITGITDADIGTVGTTDPLLDYSLAYWQYLRGERDTVPSPEFITDVMAAVIRNQCDIEAARNPSLLSKKSTEEHQ